jgi:DNA-binding Lrp family transcriptional regulator
MAQKPTKPVSSYRPLDAFDRAILRIIQQDNKTPHRTIAEAINLSAAAVQRRIAAMEEAGVIVRNAAIIDPYALYSSITAITEITLIDERAPTVDKAKAIFRKAPEVQQCYYVTGGISFVLVIVAPDMRVYESITRRLFAENELVKSFRTLVALDRVKAGSEIVIP